MKFLKKIFKKSENQEHINTNIKDLSEVIRERREKEIQKNMDEIFQNILEIPEYKLDLSIEKTPIYKESPSFIILKNKKEIILEGLVEEIQSELKLTPKIGIELEFYLYDNENNRFLEKENYKNELKLILDEIYKVSLEEKIEIEEPDKEKGIGQIEIRTKPYTNILKLAKDINKLKEIVKKVTDKKGFLANLIAQPFGMDCGSSMQVNISFLNNYNNENIYKRKIIQNEKVESDEMMYSIAGLCATLNPFMCLFINDEKDLKRYDIELSKELHKQGKYPAPSYVSWGINNRTTAIRIATPKFTRDIRKYDLEDNLNRRIEHRVPSAKADIYLVLIGVLSGILYGIKNKLNCNISKNSSNVFEDNDGLEKLQLNIDKMQNDIKEFFKLFS